MHLMESPKSVPIHTQESPGGPTRLKGPRGPEGTSTSTGTSTKEEEEAKLEASGRTVVSNKFSSLP